VVEQEMQKLEMVVMQVLMKPQVRFQSTVRPHQIPPVQQRIPMATLPRSGR
jgi:hypothetical protein